MLVIIIKFRLIAFDMDGTLVEETSCWRIIHRKFGVEDLAIKNFNDWRRGEINYRDFMMRDIELWGSGIHVSEIDEILSDFNLVPNSRNVIRQVKESGYETAIITGGLDILADKVSEELEIPHVLANGLKLDDEGYLSGEGVFRVDPLRKHKALQELINALNIGNLECIGVGDSEYDASFLEYVGMGVAVGDDDKLKSVADITIRDFGVFDLLLKYI